MSNVLPAIATTIKLRKSHLALVGTTTSSTKLSLTLNPLIGRTTPQTTRFSDVFGGRTVPFAY
jgi:hypothetical protein